MTRLLRIALQVAIFFFLLGLVMAIASSDTGAAEKAVLALVGAGLVALAPVVRRIGSA
jgi:hypothetical protein